jgi:uncharacterized protein (DUF4415 family)
MGDYIHMVAMKRRNQAKRGRVAQLKASASEAKRARDLITGVGSLYRPIKKAVTLRVDADVLGWFKKAGPGYQTRMNRALRGVMMEERKKSGE